MFPLRTFNIWRTFLFHKRFFVMTVCRWHISGRSHQQTTMKTHYREEVAQLAEWCGANNLSLNVKKTKEVCDGLPGETLLTTPHWPSTARLWRESAALNSLGVHITEDLIWTTNTMFNLQEGAIAPIHSSAGWKEQVSLHPSSPLLQGNHWERGDQLHHCLVGEL